MKKRIVAVAAASGLLAVGAMSGASADPGTATHVDSVSAAVSGSSVNVSGSATFVDVPLTVAEDGTGDGTLTGVGTDVASAKIARPVGSNNLVFTMNIADMPAIGGAPGIVYGWGLAADGADAGLYLEASRVGASGCNAGCWALYKVSGANQSTRVTTLSGTMANGVVSWTLPLTRLPATTGSAVQPGAAGLLGTINGADGAGYCCTPLDTFGPDEYIVPGATVRLGVAPAGTPAESVALSTSASSVNATTGAFSGQLPKPAAGGSYIVVAQACYAPDVCGLNSTTITI